MILDTLPPSVAIPAALLMLAGAGFTLIGAIGLVRLRTFYERVHAPTLGTSLGMVCILAASMLVFSTLQSRPVLHELAIGLAIVATTPITVMLLARAALFRDRAMDEPGAARDLSPPDAPSPPPAADAR